MKRKIFYSALAVCLALLLLPLVCVRQKIREKAIKIVEELKAPSKAPLKEPPTEEKRDYVINLPSNGIQLSKYNYSIFLVKADADGNTQWIKTYSTGNNDWADAVYAIDGGGALIAARSYSADNGYLGMYLLKVGPDGNKISLTWIKDLKNGEAKERSGDLFITTGSVYSGSGPGKIYIAGVGTNGEYQWIRNLGAGYFDWGYTSIWGREGHCVTVGQDENPSDIKSDFVVSSRDKNGNYDWSKSFGGDKYDRGYSLAPVKTGGFIAAGLTYSFGAGYDDAFIIRFNDDGREIWKKYFGGSGHDRAYDAVETQDGSFLAAGTTDSFGAGGYDAYILKMDSAGKLLWQKTFGGKYDDTAHAIAITGDNGFIAAGATNSFIPERL